MATSDLHRVSELYLGLSRNHSVKLSELIDCDTEHINSDFRTAVRWHCDQAAPKHSVQRQCNSMLRGPLDWLL